MTDPYPPQQFGHPSTWPQQTPPPGAPQPFAPAGPQEYAPLGTPPPRRRKSRTGVWIGVAVAVVVVLAGGGVLASAVTGKGPAAGLMKDSGVAACEQIRDNAAASKANPSAAATKAATQNPADNFADYQRARKQFADSRYEDLRTAGTQALDLFYQMSSSKDDSAGLALIAGGELVKAWSNLAGACAAHGVQLPKLSDG